MHANAPHKLVASVYRGDVAIYAVPFLFDEQRLDVGLKGLEQRVGGDDALPHIKGQEGFCRPPRAWVEDNGGFGRRVIKEEGHVDGDLELIPLRLREDEAGVVDIAVGNGPVVALASTLGDKEQIAQATGAHELPVSDLDDVRVLLGNVLPAHLALLSRRARRRPLEKALEAREPRRQASHQCALTPGRATSTSPPFSSRGSGAKLRDPARAGSRARPARLTS